MSENFIKIRGAKIHNLKNINVDIPRDKLTVITGISGSGKSSLAFDTLYAEGQRRYVESLSTYARQYLGVMPRPEVDRIEGLSPAIAIEQKRAAHNPRSTVGTMTEIYDWLRLLFARVGKPHCPECRQPLQRMSEAKIKEQVEKMGRGTEILILAPLVRAKKGEYRGVLEELRRRGFVRVRIDGVLHRTEEAVELGLARSRKHDIEVVVDGLLIDKEFDERRLADSLKTGLRLGKGTIIINRRLKNRKSESVDLPFSEHFVCRRCGVSLPEIEPRLFSFNSPYGACPACTGLGEKMELDPDLLIPNPNLTLAEGAIRPLLHFFRRLGEQNELWRKMIELAKKYDFSLDEPVKNLSPEKLKIILRGDGKFEGVLSVLENRYLRTNSDFVREEIKQYMLKKKCDVCAGKRLKPEALAVLVKGKPISEIVEMPVDEIKRFFETFSAGDSKDSKIARPIIKEILELLLLLMDVGLGYLTLDRAAGTLAGGEEQRIKLATQISSKLTGILYVLDEPSIGLHPRDQEKLLGTLKKLRDLGNTVVVVEHDSQTIMAADRVIDIGPGAGKNGGKVVFEGTPKELLKSKTLTGDYLSGRKKIEITHPKSQISNPKFSAFAKASADRQIQNFLIIKGVQEHNLKNIDVKIPLAKFVCVTGVSGSGKSTLVNDVLARALLKKFYNVKEPPGKHKGILGLEFINKAVLVDSSPIGRLSRSNPATYTGAFSYIREMFAETKEARARAYGPDYFSFNVKGGRCESCEGQGVTKIEMYFLPDLFIECESCKGKRYNEEVLKIEYRGKNIAEVLEMTVGEALDFFKDIPGLGQKLKTLSEVGLGYVKLGQSAASLSGGEAQRIKLAAELSRKTTGRALYILDEPTTGLHFDDIKKLISILRNLTDKGNTVLVVEHNLDVIKNADWICDLGPEGGEAGGRVVCEGTPREIAKIKTSHTGRYLSRAIRHI